MNLKNKNIAEGMRVTNGKNELKVVSWDKSYTDCLLNYLDSKGNRYVVAQNYELSGTEKDPQISWTNGRHFTANSDDEAFEEYLVYLGEVNEYDISESKKVKSTSIKESLDVADLILDKLNEFVRNNLRGLTITDRTEIFSASAYMDAKEEIEKILKKNKLESKKVKFTSIKESSDYIIYAVFPTKNGYIVNTDIKGYQYIQIANDKITKHSDWREDWFANAKKRAGFKNFDEDDMEEILLSRYEKTVRNIIDHSNLALNESLTESAKPINEKNVAKFVDELNKWCDDNVHYKDVDSAKFTKQYGKLYDFKYNVDHSFGDADVIIVWDDQGTLDLFEDDFITEKIDELAKKYGWYTEPYHDGGSDFTFGEL